jgi:hypothetical protein
MTVLAAAFRNDLMKAARFGHQLVVIDVFS